MTYKFKLHKLIKVNSMDSSALSSLIFLAIIGFIWLVPLISIVSSGKTSGGEKLAWIFAVIFISWFAWIFYLLLAPIKKRL
jgi:hypothetical protein